MLPNNYEFQILYLLYGLLFMGCVWMYLNGSSTTRKAILSLCSGCLLFNLPLFIRMENFTYEGSLVVLFYSGINWLLLSLSISILAAYQFLKRNKEESRH